MNSIKSGEKSSLVESSLPIASGDKPSSSTVVSKLGKSLPSGSSEALHADNAAPNVRKIPLRTVPKDERTPADQERVVSEILKLDKDPVKALRKALQMPKFFKSQK